MDGKGRKVRKERNSGTATAATMDNFQRAFLISLQWLEVAYRNRVWFFDVDWEKGNVALYGEPNDTTAFKADMMKMMTSTAERITERNIEEFKANG